MIIYTLEEIKDKYNIQCDFDFVNISDHFHQYIDDISLHGPSLIKSEKDEDIKKYLKELNYDVDLIIIQKKSYSHSKDWIEYFYMIAYISEKEINQILKKFKLRVFI